MVLRGHMVSAESCVGFDDCSWARAWAALVGDCGGAWAWAWA